MNAPVAEPDAPPTPVMSRRSALRALAAAVAGALAALGAPAAAGHTRTIGRCGPEPRRHGHSGSGTPPGRAVKHPDPRQGITAAGVLASALVPESARDAYDRAREIPEVLDGIYCHCDCAERDGLRSLLSCFETKMPVSCGVCSRQAKLAHELHRTGKSLREIRAAIDAEFGD